MKPEPSSYTTLYAASGGRVGLDYRTYERQAKLYSAWLAAITDTCFVFPAVADPKAEWRAA